MTASSLESNHSRKFQWLNVSSLIPVAGVLLLGGCAVGPDYEKPEVSTPTGFRNIEVSDSESSAPIPFEDTWWLAFDDPVLSELIEQANVSNYNLQIALKRWQQAQTIIRREGADLLPQLDASGSYERSEASGALVSPPVGTSPRSLYNTSLGASWELDLFGRVRRLVEAAQADAEAEQEALQDLRLIIQAEVAETYFSIRALIAEKQLIGDSIETRRQAFSIVRSRFESGAVSDLDLAQAEALLALAEADSFSLEREKSALLNRLAALTGQAAPDFNLTLEPLLGNAPIIPVGIPAELLRRRPDIRGTERQIASASARIGVATAAYFPRITLLGQGGYSSIEESNLFNSSARFWAIGPQVSLPLFQGGRLKANLDNSELAYLSAVDSYQQIVLDAMAETQTAIDARRLISQQREAESRAVNAAERASRVSRQQYESGVVDFLTFLDAERTTLDNQRRLTRVVGLEYTNTVSLIRALGGSW